VTNKNETKTTFTATFFFSDTTSLVTLLPPPPWKAQGNGTWRLWSVANTSSLPLCLHTFPPLQCRLPAQRYSASWTSPTLALLTGCKSSWTALVWVLPWVV